MELNKIYNEDCLETMAKMPNNFIDLILTSPPYNIIRPNVKDWKYDQYVDNISVTDYINWTLNIFNQFDKILKFNTPIIYNLSYGTENPTQMNLTVSEIINKTKFTLADIIIWKKNSVYPNTTSPNKLTRIVEFIYIFCRKNEYNTFITNKKFTKKNSSNQSYYSNIYNFIEAPNQDEHSNLNTATFSTKLVRQLLDIYAKPNSVVYDPFMGTGTSALGCVINSCNYIGSEISNAQCNYANNRLKPYLTQTKLF